MQKRCRFCHVKNSSHRPLFVVCHSTVVDFKARDLRKADRNISCWEGAVDDDAKSKPTCKYIAVKRGSKILNSLSPT